MNEYRTTCYPDGYSERGDGYVVSVESGGFRKAGTISVSAEHTTYGYQPATVSNADRLPLAAAILGVPVEHLRVVDPATSVVAEPDAWVWRRAEGDDGIRHISDVNNGPPISTMQIGEQVIFPTREAAESRAKRYGGTLVPLYRNSAPAEAS